MTSTTTDLPDRYRPLEEIGPEEQTPTGVIRCWRARDRVLNRDVAVRVHSPAGAAASSWINRALTAGGLANPALAMVYDASEGTDQEGVPGSAAYVVNEWIDGETLAERLGRGPLPDREVRTMMRRLTEGVAEAHRVGLAVGGITPATVVLRPSGLVGLRAVPAATGSIEGDIRALGVLLEACLSGDPDGPAQPDTPPPGAAPDLVALARRARSGEPGQGLSSVAAMASLLAERPPRTGPVPSGGRGDEAESGRRRRRRDRPAETAAGPDSGRRGPDARVRGAVAGLPRRRRTDRSPAAARPAAGDEDIPAGTAAEAPVRLDPQARPPVPPPTPVPPVPVPPSARPASDRPAPDPVRPAGPGDTVVAGLPPVADDRTRALPRDVYGPGPAVEDDEPFAVLDDDADEAGTPHDDDADDERLAPTGARRRLLVVGLPVLALALVVWVGFWLGNSVLSVAGSVDEVPGSTPPPSASAGAGDETAAEDAPPSTGAPVPIAEARVFDPFGDAGPENDGDVPLSFDGDPATAWSTVTYLRSPAFGNLKPGMGVLYDLGSEQTLAGARIATSLPGTTVEVRSVPDPDAGLDAFPVVAAGTLEGSTDLTFAEPVTGRYVLVWITQLVPSGDGFAADLAEVGLLAAG
ncbi:hypothetical protein OF117_18130 [Geodermatophilus sp. YIM 151500]|uniref:hypothetical protein n=1 Tax=Geodermatophilus sp. YIM 151500 TaxID=2984531 RepID=UPI0021E36633|nr:hypothetical protein [Geodermatophilus sp. YIM 151500]MCV2491269.1 hypothetical protein [Geodermatophilus sp. YIM 151500]